MDAQELWAAHTGYTSPVPPPYDCSSERCSICGCLGTAPGPWRVMHNVQPEYDRHFCASCLDHYYSVPQPQGQDPYVHKGVCCTCSVSYPIATGFAITQGGDPVLQQCAACYRAQVKPGVDVRQPHGIGAGTGEVDKSESFDICTGELVVQLEPLPASAYRAPPGPGVTLWGNQKYISLLGSCVHQIPGNALEWTLLGNPKFGQPGLVVNCVHPDHPVGSIIYSSGHTCMSTDWLFDSFQQYLEAEQAWRTMREASGHAVPDTRGENYFTTDPDQACTFAKYALMRANKRCYLE